MKIIKETDPRFMNIEKKIGMFVLIAVIGIVLVIAFIGIQQDIFTPKTKLYFMADSGKDLNEGLAVKLSGFKIGKVEKLSLDDALRVRVELSIYKEYMKWIKTDSKAKLAKEGLIGDSIIEITPGSATVAQVADNGMIVFERAKGVGEMAEEVKAEVMPVLTDIKQIIHYVNDPNGDVKQILRNINKLSAGTLTTKDYIDILLKDADKNLNATTAKINSLVDSTKQTLENTDNIVKKLDKGIPDMMDKVNKTLENVHKTSEDIKNATSKTAPQLPSLIGKGNDIADSTKDVLDSVKKTWPLRSYIKDPEEKTLKVDTYE